MAMEFKRRDNGSRKEYGRIRKKDTRIWIRRLYELEDAIHKSITKPSGGLARQAGHVNNRR